MDEFAPWQVYSNILKMFEYRGIKLKSDALGVDELSRNLNHYSFVSIEGTRDQRDPREHHIIVLLLSPNSSFAHKSGEFKKVFSRVPIVADDSNNVIVVAHQRDGDKGPLSNYIEKQLVVYRQEHPNVYVEAYDYSMFCIEKPKHVLVPLHVIPSAAEVDEFCAQHYIQKEHFTKIKKGDVMAVWLGLRVGDVVKVYRLNESSGTEIDYHICE